VSFEFCAKKVHLPVNQAFLEGNPAIWLYALNTPVVSDSALIVKELQRMLHKKVQMSRLFSMGAV
jgi:hypothetical protein